MTTPNYREQALELAAERYMDVNDADLDALASWASRIAEEERAKREAFEDLTIAYRSAENHWSNVYITAKSEDARRACSKARDALDNAIEAARGARVSGGEPSDG